MLLFKMWWFELFEPSYPKTKVNPDCRLKGAFIKGVCINVRNSCTS